MKPFTKEPRYLHTLETHPTSPTDRQCMYAGDLISTGLLDGIDDRNARLLTGVYDGEEDSPNDPLLSLRSSSPGNSFQTDRIDHVEYLSHIGSKSSSPNDSSESSKIVDSTASDVESNAVPES